MYHSLMYRVMSKRRCIQVFYLASRGSGTQLKVASICSFVTSIAVAMPPGVTAVEHLCVAMDRLVVFKGPVISLARAVKIYHESWASQCMYVCMYVCIIIVHAYTLCSSSNQKVLPCEKRELLEKSGESATEHELQPKLQLSLATRNHSTYHPVATSFPHFEPLI